MMNYSNIQHLEQMPKIEQRIPTEDNVSTSGKKNKDKKRKTTTETTNKHKIFNVHAMTQSFCEYMAIEWVRR